MPASFPKPALLRITVTLAACLLSASVAAAEGDAATGSNSETDRNRFSFHPSIEVSTVADTNVHLDSDNDGDLGIFVLPRVELGYQGSWFNLGADGAVDVRQYVDSSAPNDVFYRASGFAELGLMPGLTVGLSDAYVPTPVDLGLPEDDSANLVQSNRAVADVSYWRALPAGREMRVSVQGTRFMSDSFRTQVQQGVWDDHFRADFWEAAAIGEVQTPLLESTSGFVRSEARYRRFDDSAASDFTDFAFLLGVRTHWHRDVDFDVAAGYGLVDFVHESLSHRFLAQANLRYRMPAGATLRLSFVNRNTADIVGNDFLETGGRLGLSKRFGERTAASVEVFVSRFDNQDWNQGANLYGGVETEVRRQLSRRLQLAFHYRYWDNGGGYTMDDFTQHRAMVTLSYRR